MAAFVAVAVLAGGGVYLVTRHSGDGKSVAPATAPETDATVPLSTPRQKVTTTAATPSTPAPNKTAPPQTTTVAPTTTTPTKSEELDALPENEGSDAAGVYSFDDQAVFWTDLVSRKWWLATLPDGSYCKMPMRE